MTTEFPGVDMEKLRNELIELSEKGEIKHTKTFLKKCTESVLKQIMVEYVKEKQKQSKDEFTVVFITLLLSLLEKSGYVHFVDGYESFLSKVLADENAMFVIADLMPACNAAGYYFKYFSAVLFLSSLCYSNISFGHDTDDATKSESESEPDTKTDLR